GRLERTRFREQLAQVGGPVLREGAADQAAAEHDAPLAPARADPQDPGLPRQADDLEDLAESEVFQASDEAHPHTPGRGAQVAIHMHATVPRSRGVLRAPRQAT